MDFKKYCSIENSYNKKFIEKFKELLGQDIFNDTSFVVREKLDGANIQLLFQPHQKMKVGKRTSYLNEDENFYSIWDTLGRYDRDINHLQDLSNSVGVTIRLFGELYGPGINNRVDYGNEKKIAIFDAYISGKEYKLIDNGDSVLQYGWVETDNQDEKLLTQQEFEAFMFNGGRTHLLCPYLGLFDTLEEALDIDVETLQKSGSNGSEGIVIQPFNKIIRDFNNERFILKKKTSKFNDKPERTKIPKEKDAVYDLNVIFRGYITKNRVLDMFAKHGMIKEQNQIGEYLRLILEDAKKDFVKDHDLTILLPDFNKKRERDLYNVGSLIVNLLREYL